MQGRSSAPAFFVLGVLLEQQFQIVPLHDPTSGWSAHLAELRPHDRRLR